MYNLFDKYRSISIERVNGFLSKKSIEHKYTDFRKIEFKFENWSWDLYIDDDYFKMNLVFTINEETAIGKRMNKLVAEEVCLELTKMIKVLKVHYTSHEYVNEEEGNKLVKYNVLLFSFESFCYNMYDFHKLFYDGLNVILTGFKEYHKLYDKIEPKLQRSPIGFVSFESGDTTEKSQHTNRNRMGFV